MSHCACELRTRGGCREGVFGRSKRLALGSESCGEGGEGGNPEQRDGRICSAEQLRDPVGWEVDTADSVEAERRGGSGSRRKTQNRWMVEKWKRGLGVREGEE